MTLPNIHRRSLTQNPLLVENRNNSRGFSPHSSVSPVHLLELLIVIIICGFFIEGTFAIWRRPFKRKRRQFHIPVLSQETFPELCHLPETVPYYVRLLPYTLCYSTKPLSGSFGNTSVVTFTTPPLSWWMDVCLYRHHPKLRCDSEVQQPVLMDWDCSTPTASGHSEKNRKAEPNCSL